MNVFIPVAIIGGGLLIYFLTKKASAEEPPVVTGNRFIAEVMYYDNPFAGATVTVNGVTKITGADGIAIVENLILGDPLTVVVSASGFWTMNYNGTVQAGDHAVRFNLSLSS